MARALLSGGDFLILDEPTAGLDAASEATVLAAVRAAAREQGRAVVLVAHRPAALAIADRVVAVTAARIAGTPARRSRVRRRSAWNRQRPRPGGRRGDLDERRCRDPGFGRFAARGPRALWQIALAGRPVALRLLLAVCAGVAAAGAAIGLTATSAWLISRAAEQPPVLDLMVAVTAVRAFGDQPRRPALRRAAGRPRRRLPRSWAGCAAGPTPGWSASPRPGLAEFRSGDLLSRLVDDIDGLADLWLRVLLPYLVAGVSPRPRRSHCLWLLVPAAAAALGDLAAVRRLRRARPHHPGRAARRAADLGGREASLPPRLSRSSTGAPEILVAGATEAQAEPAGRDRSAPGRRRRPGPPPDPGSERCCPASQPVPRVWIGLVAGIAAVRAGSIGGVVLAVVALTPIAVHEAAAGLVPASQHLPGLAAMAGTTARRDVAARSGRGAGPRRSPSPRGRTGCAAAACGRATAGPGPDALVLPDVRDRRRASGCWSPVRAARARAPSPPCWCGSSILRPASVELVGLGPRRRHPAARAATTFGASSACAPRIRTSSTPRSSRTSGWPGRRQPTAKCGRAGRQPSSGLDRLAARGPGDARSASTERGCRAGSASDCRWPGRSWPTRRSSSSTNRPSTWTRPRPRP